MANSKLEARERRKVHIRKTVRGTKERPRLSVFRSARHIFAQVINDDENQVLVAVGTMGKTIRTELGKLNKTEQAKKIGTKIAELCKSKGIEQVVFDRSGFRYHGRVSALADSARKSGLQF